MYVDILQVGGVGRALLLFTHEYTPDRVASQSPLDVQSDPCTCDGQICRIFSVQQYHTPSPCSPASPPTLTIAARRMCRLMSTPSSRYVCEGPLFGTVSCSGRSAVRCQYNGTIPSPLLPLRPPSDIYNHYSVFADNQHSNSSYVKVLVSEQLRRAEASTQH